MMSLLAVSVVVLWLSVAFVPITTQCLQTHSQCTRWGPKHGAKYAYPLTVSFAQLAMVSVALCPSLARVRERVALAKRCTPAGIVFGINYGIAHMALQRTSATLFALFHASTIVFIVGFSRVLLGERLESATEVISCVGLVLGTAISAVDVIGTTSLLGLILTFVDCVFAGIVVVLLRRAMVGGSSPLAVTCLKTGIGALAVLPFALGIEGLPHALNKKQLVFLILSAAAILVYHANVSLLCGLAPAIVVGVFEATKTIPDFAITALVKGTTSSSFLFWVGAALILASASVFNLARTASHKKRRSVGSDDHPSTTSLLSPLLDMDDNTGVLPSGEESSSSE